MKIQIGIYDLGNLKFTLFACTGSPRFKYKFSNAFYEVNNCFFFCIRFLRSEAVIRIENPHFSSLYALNVFDLISFDDVQTI